MVPWAYVRRQLAKDWCVPPWVIDEAPIGEIEEALAIRRVESEASSGR